MTNRYNLPFAPIVGISGHGHTLIFGCAFISDKTTDTFKWLFEAFLESMGGKHPKTIITDQDQAMRRGHRSNNATNNSQDLFLSYKI